MSAMLPRWTHRRFDKLRGWIALLVGASIPILLCWSLPNLLAAFREQQTAASAAIVEREQSEMAAQYADLIQYCDSDPPQTSAAQAPAAPHLLLVRNGHLSEWQSTLPDEWQPSSPDDDAIVVICLGREGARPVDNVCADGTFPDFSETANYEAEILEDLSGQQGVRLAQETTNKHPDYTGQRLKRYGTDVTVYTASGELIEQTTLWGSYPEICTEPSAFNLSVTDYLTGDRLTEFTLLSWLTDRFD